MFGPASIEDCLKRLDLDDLISSSPEGPWIKLNDFDFPPSQRRQQPEIPAKQLAATRPQNLTAAEPKIYERHPHRLRWYLEDILVVIFSTIAPLIAPLCEYFFPFYGAWLLGGFVVWIWQMASFEKHWFPDSLLVMLLVSISWPAGVIICGYEKYMRWDGSFFGIRFGQGQQVSNEASDFWFLMFMIGGGLLFVLFLYGLCAGASNAASDIIATGIKKAKDND